jgi:hypothetical protein
MKRKIHLIILLLLITACNDPKYTVKTTKIIPSTKEAKECMSSCNQKYEKGKKEYITKCKERVIKCQALAKERVSANFAKYQQAYRDDLCQYKERMISYHNEFIQYQEELEDYIERKDELRERYNEAMDKYYEKKDRYKEELEKYQEWEQEKRENEKYKRACNSSSKNRFACQKVDEYERKHRFDFASNRPKKPRYKLTRPTRVKHIPKPQRPTKPTAPLQPVLSKVIATEQMMCNNNCTYELENNCFPLCGGSVKYEKICIENCEE